MDRSRSRENPKCCHHSLDSRRDCRVAARAGLFPGRIHSKVGRGHCHYGPRNLPAGATASVFTRRAHEPRSSRPPYPGGSRLFPRPLVFQPEWRAALVNDFGIQLPSTLTPQPWITLGYLVSFAAGLSWLYVVSTQDLELREVRFQLRLFTSGIALLAAICIALYLARTTLAFWHNDQNFGPFPNRNQTGALFALAAIVILACAQDDLRKRRKRWIVWVLALVLIGAAIILNFRALESRSSWRAAHFGLARRRSDSVLPGDSRLESLFLFFFYYSRRCCFSAGKHSRDFIFTISAVPTSHRISGGKFFMTRCDSSVIRRGAGLVLEISNRSLQFS